MTSATTHTSSRPGRATIVGVIIVLIALVAGVVVVLTGGETPPVATDRPDNDWNALTPTREQSAEPIDLEEGKRVAFVIIGAQPETCWRGFIGSAEIQDCGEAVYEVTGAPATLGINVRHKNTDNAFLGLAVWDDEGEQYFAEDTRKKLGLISTTVFPEPPAK